MSSPITSPATSAATSGSSGSSSVSIPQTAAAGALSVTQPPQTATSYYKIAESQSVTFAWSFSDLLVTPTHLTVSAVCDNGNTYPVGPTDGIIDGTATEVVWDVYSYQQNHPNTPLAQASYTLHIWDDRGPNAARSPGHLQPNSAVKFALYTPQGYTAISDGWKCTTCNGALSSAAAHPLSVALIATFLIMFLSGFTLLRRH